MANACGSIDIHIITHQSISWAVAHLRQQIPDLKHGRTVLRYYRKGPFRGKLWPLGQPSWIFSFTNRLNHRWHVLTNCVTLVIIFISLVTIIKTIVIWPMNIRNWIFRSFWQSFWILWLRICLIIDHICLRLYHFVHSLYKHSFIQEDSWIYSIKCM